MWSNSARFLMIRIKVQSHRGFTFPVPLGVVDEWFKALEDLVRVGEVVLKFVPVPKEARARRHMSWVKTLSPSKIISTANILLEDLSRHKGLDMVEVETGDVLVKVHLR